MFYAVSKHGGKFKALFEVVFQNMTTACFTIDKKGMFLEFLTTQNILFTLFLPSECFQEYIYDEKEPSHVGLNSHISKEFFKYLKNKDIFSMKMEKPYIFEFAKVSEDDVQMVLSVCIENIQNFTPMKHLNYTSNCVSLNTINFNQLCRSFNTISTVNVIKCNGQITFSFETGITTKSIVFGKENQNDIDMVHYIYYSDRFTRISKISSFVDEVIELKIEKEKPLYIYCESVIGYMKIFIYPKEDN